MSISQQYKKFWREVEVGNDNWDSEIIITKETATLTPGNQSNTIRRKFILNHK